MRPDVAGSQRGAERCAAMLTLIATAKLNGVDPQALAGRSPGPHPTTYPREIGSFAAVALRLPVLLPRGGASGVRIREGCFARTTYLKPDDIPDAHKVLGAIWARWPLVRVLLRADSGFAREPLMAWCEDARVDYVLGLAPRRNTMPEPQQVILPGPWIRFASCPREAARCGRVHRRATLSHPQGARSGDATRPEKGSCQCCSGGRSTARHHHWNVDLH